jgi:hypothetical protein
VLVTSDEIQSRGYYMLFILNDKGVPSKGRFIALRCAGERDERRCKARHPIELQGRSE